MRRVCPRTQLLPATETGTPRPPPPWRPTTRAERGPALPYPQAGAHGRAALRGDPAASAVGTVARAAGPAVAQARASPRSGGYSVNYTITFTCVITQDGKAGGRQGGVGGHVCGMACPSTHLFGGLSENVIRPLENIGRVGLGGRIRQTVVWETIYLVACYDQKREMAGVSAEITSLWQASGGPFNVRSVRGIPGYESAWRVTLDSGRTPFLCSR